MGHSLAVGEGARGFFWAGSAGSPTPCWEPGMNWLAQADAVDSHDRIRCQNTLPDLLSSIGQANSSCYVIAHVQTASPGFIGLALLRTSVCSKHA
jgi:hypothetical protein